MKKKTILKKKGLIKKGGNTYLIILKVTGMMLFDTFLSLKESKDKRERILN
jgi:hypothetical protein